MEIFAKVLNKICDCQNKAFSKYNREPCPILPIQDYVRTSYKYMTWVGCDEKCDEELSWVWLATNAQIR